ncbi:MAG: hypothetical protein WAW42_12020 [Candidatus Competibacteraceae bacterium]
MTALTIDMQGVDMILSMPEYYINYNLQLLLQNGTTTTGGSLSKISLSVGTNAWINGTVDSLSTRFDVAGSVQKVRFLVHFASGTMDYYDLGTGVPVKETADITGLTFAVLVDLSYADLDANSSIPADVKAAIKARMSNLGAGAFTIRQFFMDIDDAAISSPDPVATVYPPKFPASAIAMFPTYMRLYLTQVASAGGTTLGYAVKVQNPGSLTDPTASFPPTDLMLVTNAYQPDTGQKPDPTMNCLNYLMMTGANPQFPSNLKPWWGNFVQPGDDTNGIFGAMAIRSGLFQSFLLKKLGPIACRYVTVNDVDGSLDIDTTAAVGAFTPTANGGTFSVKGITGKSHLTNTFSNDDAQYSFDFSVNLTINPATNTITILRTSVFTIAVTHWYGIEGHAVTSECGLTFTVPVTYTITLLGVSDGALQVSVTESYPQEPPNEVSDTDYFWLITGTTGSWSFWVSVQDTFDSVLAKGIAACIPDALPPDMKTALETSLNLAPFVFPGGAQLYMKNPLFTDAGDLTVGMSFKA